MQIEWVSCVRVCSCVREKIPTVGGAMVVIMVNDQGSVIVVPLVLCCVIVLCCFVLFCFVLFCAARQEY